MSEEIEGTVRDLSRYGEGIVKTQIGMVFVHGVLPGERVMLSGVRKQGKITRAERARLVDRSAQRVEPACTVVDRCGGCPLMIWKASAQAEFKRAQLVSAIAKLPGGAALEIGWVGTRASLCYRKRARMAWDATGPRLRLGYRPRRSEQITDVRSCPILDPTLDAALALIRTSLAPHLRQRGEIHLALGEGERASLALRSEEPQPPELYGALEALVKDAKIAGAALRAGGANTDAIWGAPREVRKHADGAPLHGTVAGFSQAHDEVNAALVRCVVELARPAERIVLELFAGSGNLTVALAREAKSIVAVEREAAAADACRENLKVRGLTATVRNDDAESYRPAFAPDVAVLDPPRTGAPGAIRRLVHAGVREIVYVSCDPPTLARDLEALGAAGYTLTHAIALDMFPQTAHLECVVRAERRE
jgi:23S rRNA (uracil1939-C5)-methyltransferase